MSVNVPAHFNALQFYLWADFHPVIAALPDATTKPQDLDVRLL